MGTGRSPTCRGFFLGETGPQCGAAKLPDQHRTVGANSADKSGARLGEGRITGGGLLEDADQWCHSLVERAEKVGTRRELTRLLRAGLFDQPQRLQPMVADMHHLQLRRAPRVRISAVVVTIGRHRDDLGRLCQPGSGRGGLEAEVPGRRVAETIGGEISMAGFRIGVLSPSMNPSRKWRNGFPGHRLTSPGG